MWNMKKMLGRWYVLKNKEIVFSCKSFSEGIDYITGR